MDPGLSSVHGKHGNSAFPNIESCFAPRAQLAQAAASVGSHAGIE